MKEVRLGKLKEEKVYSSFSNCNGNVYQATLLAGLHVQGCPHCPIRSGTLPLEECAQSQRAPGFHFHQTFIITFIKPPVSFGFPVPGLKTFEVDGALRWFSSYVSEIKEEYTANDMFLCMYLCLYLSIYPSIYPGFTHSDTDSLL